MRLARVFGCDLYEYVKKLGDKDNVCCGERQVTKRGIEVRIKTKRRGRGCPDFVTFLKSECNYLIIRCNYFCLGDALRNE